MPEEPYSLKVRVNMAPVEPEPKARTPDVHYRWDRIAIVAVASLLFAWLVFKAIQWLGAPPTEAPEPVESVSGQVVELAQAPTVAANKTPTADLAPRSDTAQAKSEPVVREELPKVARQSEPVEPQPVIEPAVNVPAVAPVASKPARDSSVATQSTAVAGDAGLQQTGGKIVSGDVKRFVLTNRIEAREPTGGLADIEPDSRNNDIMTVFAFSEVENMRGDTVYYRWIYAGKAVATVKVAVASNSWRSHSSKFVTITQRGDWQVELRNDRDELLAFAEFNY
jgi:cytoskeletal protein RodZ